MFDNMNKTQRQRWENKIRRGNYNAYVKEYQQMYEKSKRLSREISVLESTDTMHPKHVLVTKNKLRNKLNSNLHYQQFLLKKLNRVSTYIF